MAIPLSPGDLRAAVVGTIEALSGRHDQRAIYAEPAGDPGLVGPDSVSWEIHSDMGSVAAAGLGAIIMEILHPAVMAGVADLSSYQTETERRARNTMGYVLITTFGNTKAATRTIERVRTVHGEVNGTMPDGRPYRALDPELIGWVHTAIPWAILRAFETYNRPLSTEEKDRYLTEQAVIGRMGGAGDDIPETMADLEAYVERMRPKLAVTEQTRGFLDFLVGDVDGPLRAGPIDQFNRRVAVHASMATMPEWARRLAGFHHPDLAQRLYVEPSMRLQARLIRWAYGVPPYRRLADERVGARVRAVAAA